MRGFCVIGKSLPHTLSPEIHGLFGAGDYAVEELPDQEALKRFVQSRRYAGYNVTIPYKRDIMPMLDKISEEALEVGAVNTVVERDGQLVGYNTDVGGMRFALESAGISVGGKRVLILGSGGAARTASYVCRLYGAKSVDIVSRQGPINYDNCYRLTDTQVIVNATPVGMSPNADESPIDIVKFIKAEGVFDVVYNPLRTRLTYDAERNGVKAACGLEMLVEQARLAHNIFVGRDEIDQNKSIQVCKTLGISLSNITLAGMAGSGKSVLSRAVADKLHRPLYDIDEMVESSEGMSIADIFATRGEGYFRAAERAAVKRACSNFGAVIALGGGAVLDDDNAFYARSNGVVAVVERPVDMLALEGRPLVRSAEEAAQLYAQRKPVYDRIADFKVQNDGALEDARDRLISAFYASIEGDRP